MGVELQGWVPRGFPILGGAVGVLVVMKAGGKDVHCNGSEPTSPPLLALSSTVIFTNSPCKHLPSVYSNS